MSGYLSSRKLTNVNGRINYITDKGKQENVVDYYNTTDNEFWSILAKESKERFKEVKAKGKCCEARELIIGIPQYSDITAKELCDIFKSKYNVECICAIHQNNKDGVINRHCHLIFSERKRLDEPEIIGEKKAVRTYYYDAKGKKCKKDEAVKVVKKGTILQKGTTRYFTDKNDYFKTQQFVYDCKQLFLKETLDIDWSFEEEKINKELSEKHIGKNNPKEKYIKENNKLKGIVRDLCKVGDFIYDSPKGTTLKAFKQNYEVKSFTASKCEENQIKVNNFLVEMQEIHIETVKKEVKKHNKINEDVTILNENSHIFKPLQEDIISDYENETKTREKPKVIEILKEKLSKLLQKIQKLIHMQDYLGIERKNQIKVEQNSRTNKLYIKDSNYMRQQKQKDDYEIEF